MKYWYNPLINRVRESETEPKDNTLMNTRTKILLSKWIEITKEQYERLGRFK